MKLHADYKKIMDLVGDALSAPYGELLPEDIKKRCEEYETIGKILMQYVDQEDKDALIKQAQEICELLGKEDNV